MDNSEKLADILAEMRDFAEHRDYDSDGNMSTTALRVFADRIEAAAKRERIQRDKVSFRCGDCARFGGDCDAGDSDGNEDRVACEKFVRRAIVTSNAAAMRAALEAVRDAFDSNDFGAMGDHPSSEVLDMADAVRRKVDAALAAPPRNCDKYATWKDAWDAFAAAYFGPTDPGEMEYYFGVWLFAPAEGKEARHENHQ